MKILSILNSVINYIIPPRCFSCAEFIDQPYGFCADCWRKLNFIARPYCQKCGRMFSIIATDNMLCGKCISTRTSYDIIRSLLVFDQQSRKLLHDFKYHDKTSMAKIFSEMLYYRYIVDIKDVDLIVPVPMHKFKRLLRMYNQAQILAQQLSILLSKPIYNDQLIKHKWTKSQIYLSQKLRMNNVTNSIIVNKKYSVQGKVVLLVDDVVTTGTTINECSRLLKKAGAKTVYVLSIASTKNI